MSAFVKGLFGALLAVILIVALVALYAVAYNNGYSDAKKDFGISRAASTVAQR